jgi:outer membrane protein assembly factor BamB
MRGRAWLPLIALALTLACATTGPQLTPGAPHGLAAVSGLDSRVDLDWREPSTGEPDSYRIYRSEAGGDFERLVECDGAETEYTDASAVNGTYYEYRMTALTGDGESDPSGTVWATPYYDFEEAWTSESVQWLPGEGDGVLYCIVLPEDSVYLCRMSTDGEYEQLSDQMCWGFPAAGPDEVYTMSTPMRSALLRVWTMDLEFVESVGYLETEYKDLGYYSGELFTINIDTGVVDVLDTSGNYLRSVGEPGHEGPGMTDPVGLDVSPDGTLYVVDQAGESLLAFDAVTGELVWRISAEELPADFLYPSDAAVAPDGFVYLLSGYSGDFLVIDAAGRQIKRVSTDFTGTFDLYAAVADDFTVALSDGYRDGGYMTALRPAGSSADREPPAVALKGGGTR